MSQKMDHKNYEENGFLDLKALYNTESLEKINTYISKLPPKSLIPFSKLTWGYGNLVNDDTFLELIRYTKILDIVSGLINPESIICNHILVVNKPPLFGPDVEWHQEFANINTFAPGYNHQSDLNMFLQIFVALEDHTIDNGPLLVIPGSHKLGLLDHDDIVNTNLSHKRRVNFEDLQGAANSLGIKPILLKAGSAIAFNHLLIHSSASNNSLKSRRALLFQFRSSLKPKNDEIFGREVKHRTDFLVNFCNEKIHQLTSKNLYKDMK